MDKNPYKFFKLLILTLQISTSLSQVCADWKYLQKSEITTKPTQPPKFYDLKSEFNNIGSDFSIAFFFKVNGLDPASKIIIACLGLNSSPICLIQTIDLATTTLKTYLAEVDPETGKTKNEQEQTGIDISPGDWNFIYLIYKSDNHTLKLYVDKNQDLLNQTHSPYQLYAPLSAPTLWLAAASQKITSSSAQSYYRVAVTDSGNPKAIESRYGFLELVLALDMENMGRFDKQISTKVSTLDGEIIGKWRGRDPSKFDGTVPTAHYINVNTGELGTRDYYTSHFFGFEETITIPMFFQFEEEFLIENTFSIFFNIEIKKKTLGVGNFQYKGKSFNIFCLSGLDNTEQKLCLKLNFNEMTANDSDHIKDLTIAVGGLAIPAEIKLGPGAAIPTSPGSLKVSGFARIAKLPGWTKFKLYLEISIQGSEITQEIELDPVVMTVLSVLTIGYPETSVSKNFPYEIFILKDFNIYKGGMIIKDNFCNSYRTFGLGSSQDNFFCKDSNKISLIDNSKSPARVICAEVDNTGDCAHVAPAGQCQRCKQYSFLKNGNCIIKHDQISFCYKYNSDGSCNECLAGYKLSTTTSCLACTTNEIFDPITKNCITADQKLAPQLNFNKGDSAYVFFTGVQVPRDTRFVANIRVIKPNPSSIEEAPYTDKQYIRFYEYSSGITFTTSLSHALLDENSPTERTQSQFFYLSTVAKKDYNTDAMRFQIVPRHTSDKRFMVELKLSIVAPDGNCAARNDKGKCYRCIHGKFFYKFGCYDQCPEGTGWSILLGYFVCKKCYFGSKSCEYGYESIKCEEGFIKNKKGFCVRNREPILPDEQNSSKCADGYFIWGKSCAKCHFSCSSCSGWNREDCVKCADKREINKENKFCMKECTNPEEEKDSKVCIQPKPGSKILEIEKVIFISRLPRLIIKFKERANYERILENIEIKTDAPVKILKGNINLIDREISFSLEINENFERKTATFSSKTLLLLDEFYIEPFSIETTRFSFFSIQKLESAMRTTGNSIGIVQKSSLIILLVFNTASFVNTVKLSQFFEFTFYYNKEYPKNAEEFMQVFATTLVDVGFNPFRNFETKTKCEAPLRMKENGLVCNFLRNSGGMVSYLISTAVFCLVGFLVINCYFLNKDPKKESVKKWHNKKHTYLKKILFLALDTTYYELALFSALQMRDFSFVDVKDVLGLVAALVFYVISFFILIKSVIVINKYEIYKEKTLLTNFEKYFLLKDPICDNSKILGRYFLQINQLMSILIALVMVMFYDFPYAQIGFCTLTFFSFWVWSAISRPMLQKYENIKLVIRRFFLWFICFLFIFIVPGNNLLSAQQKYFFIGFLLILLLSILVIQSFTLGILEAIFKIWKWCMARNNKKPDPKKMREFRNSVLGMNMIARNSRVINKTRKKSQWSRRPVNLRSVSIRNIRKFKKNQIMAMEKDDELFDRVIGSPMKTSKYKTDNGVKEIGKMIEMAIETPKYPGKKRSKLKRDRVE